MYVCMYVQEKGIPIVIKTQLQNTFKCFNTHAYRIYTYVHASTTANIVCPESEQSVSLVYMYARTTVGSTVYTVCT